MNNRLTSIVFNSNGSWLCPAGVTKVLVSAMGGGAGGNGGTTGSAGVAARGGSGGLGVTLQTRIIDVVPNTTYTITIGTGGTGGAISTAGNPGTNTSFGALMVWKGCPSTPTEPSTLSVYRSTTFFSSPHYYQDNGSPYEAIYSCPGAFGNNGLNTSAFLTAYPGKLGLQPPTPTNPGSTAGGSGGQGLNGEGLAGLGGTGVVAGNGGAGTNAAANSGAGGGGGAGGGSTTKLGGIGGDGGSGKLIVMWVE